METLCFCGGSPQVEEWGIGGDEVLFALSCDRCEVSTDWYPSEDEAVEDWVEMQSSIEEHVNGD